ncbi:hypothetical protein JCM11641_002602 [Rhodosporidiobolus odoratus]
MTAATLSLEPPKLYAGDGRDQDPFARPARLQDVMLEDGTEVFSRADSKKSLSERLFRVWAERGDYSQLTADSIRNPKEEDDHAKDDEDTRPSVEDMRKLQETMLNNLALARGELSTALDLLSVLSVPTDPPDIDPEALPLPQQTLTLVPTAVPPRPSANPAENSLAALPLATSLDALKSSAKAFFRASEELIPLDEAELAAAQGTSASSASKPRPRTRAPDPWPAILQLHASSPRTLLPLGAMKGATLSGKGETRAAREVGVFFGCEEAKEDFRRAAVARVSEIAEEGAEKRKGRKLVVEVEVNGGIERAVWDETEQSDGVEKLLRARGRSAFAEEVFAQLTKEARTDPSLRARLNLGRSAEGDTVMMEGLGWVLRVTMVLSPPPPTTSTSFASASVLLPLLRLLYLHEYASRRRSTPAPARPLLSTLSVALNYLNRMHSLDSILGRMRQRVQDAEVEVGLESTEASTAMLDTLQIADGKKELGGRALLRVGDSHTFHIFHSLPLPSSTPATSSHPALQPALLLRVPLKSPIPMPSLQHLENFLGEQVVKAVKAHLAARSRREETKEAT